MTKKTAALISISLAATSAAAMTAAAPAAKRTTCAKASGETLFQDRAVRVLQRITPVKGDSDAFTVRLYACRVGRRALRHLETFRNTLDGTVRVQSARVAGDRWILLSGSAETGVSDSDALYLYDLRDGKRRFMHFEDGSDAIGAAFATGTGAVVFTTGDGVLWGADQAGVRKLTGDLVSNVAGSGKRIYWTAADVVGSATLEGVATESS